MNSTKVKVIEVDLKRIEHLIEQLKRTDLKPDDRELIENILLSYVQLLGMIRDKNTSIRRLQKLLFGARSERIQKVLRDRHGSAGEATAEASDGDSSDRPAREGRRRRGHGRRSADDYTGAEKIWVGHPTLQAGDPCPECDEGTLYSWPTPGVLVRLIGGPPIRAKVYRLEKLRCNLCGRVFTAPTPEEVGPEKFDATTIGTIALLKYGSGMPFNRCQGLEAAYGIPLPASTQWEVVRDGAARIRAAYQELIRQAAQGEIVHNDDTGVKIIELMRENARQDPHMRRGMFTTGIVSIDGGRKIALFFSGRRHAGENLAEVLKRRARELGPPIHMSDGLSRNLPGELKTIVANCLAHARRKFVDVVEAFPSECEYVLEELAKVYHLDAEVKRLGLTPEERLARHVEQSGPVMERLHTWLRAQLDEHRVEPNSSLGGAIQYMLNRWEPLTLFLREPRAPLDNNTVERALKKSILNRKNAYFYRTRNGADVGDLYMSLIYTCQLNDVNAFDYLTELLRHASDVASTPADWMPWTYRQTLEQSADRSASSDC